MTHAVSKYLQHKFKLTVNKRKCSWKFNFWSFVTFSEGIFIDTNELNYDSHGLIFHYRLISLQAVRARQHWVSLFDKCTFRNPCAYMITLKNKSSFLFFLHVYQHVKNQNHLSIHLADISPEKILQFVSLEAVSSESKNFVRFRFTL